MASKHVSYSCDLCGRRFKNFEEADECEKLHKIPEKISKPEYSSEDRKNHYPLSILICFKDGTSARYYRK